MQRSGSGSTRVFSPPPPRLPLRAYGGALATIPEQTKNERPRSRSRPRHESARSSSSTSPGPPASLGLGIVEKGSIVPRPEEEQITPSADANKEKQLLTQHVQQQYKPSSRRNKSSRSSQNNTTSENGHDDKQNHEHSSSKSDNAKMRRSNRHHRSGRDRNKESRKKGSKPKKQRSSSQTHGSHHASSLRSNDVSRRSKSCSHVPSDQDDEDISHALGELKQRHQVKRIDPENDECLLVDFPHAKAVRHNDPTNLTKNILNLLPILHNNTAQSSDNSHNFHPDSRGRCIHHPQNRLRKKKLFGGWKVLMKACPDCCVEELRRLQLSKKEELAKGMQSNQSTQSDEDARGTNSSKNEQEKKQQSDGTATIKVEFEPNANRAATGQGGLARFLPTQCMSQQRTRMNSSNDTASITKSSCGSSFSSVALDATAISRVGNDGSHPKQGSRNSPPNMRTESTSKRDKKQLLQVLNLAWTDINGTPGLYSGTVNSNYFPHGNGAMVYDTGMRIEGVWKRGKWKRQSHPADSTDHGQKEGQRNEVKRGKSMPRRGSIGDDESTSSRRSKSECSSSRTKKSSSIHRSNSIDDPKRHPKRHSSKSHHRKKSSKETKRTSSTGSAIQ